MSCQIVPLWVQYNAVPERRSRPTTQRKDKSTGTHFTFIIPTKEYTLCSQLCSAYMETVWTLYLLWTWTFTAIWRKCFWHNDHLGIFYFFKGKKTKTFSPCKQYYSLPFDSTGPNRIMQEEAVCDGEEGRLSWFTSLTGTIRRARSVGYYSTQAKWKARLSFTSMQPWGEKLEV